VVDTAEQILLLAGDAQVIGIDEAQFFDLSLVDVCQQLARNGRRIGQRVMLGAQDVYEPRCRLHFEPPQNNTPAPMSSTAHTRDHL